MSRSHGGTEEEIVALSSDAWGEVFGDCECAVLEYAAAMTAMPVDIDDGHEGSEEACAGLPGALDELGRGDAAPVGVGLEGLAGPVEDHPHVLGGGLEQRGDLGARVSEDVAEDHDGALPGIECALVGLVRSAPSARLRCGRPTAMRW